jgi:glycosyltransferase involved in cell wall biosynthesis
MPVYNGEQFIQQALDSLLDQDYRHFELIISDNASTDRTADICESYAAKDARVRYYRNEEDCGPVANFNRVLDFAGGEYFMWAACDDLWEPTYISTLLQSLMMTRSGVLAFSAFDNINEHGRQIRTYPQLFKLPSEGLFTRLQNYITQEEFLGKANPIYGLMRRTSVQKAGGLKIWGKNLWGSDMLIVFKLLTSGNLVLSHDLLFHKRLLSSQASSSQEPVKASLASAALRRVLHIILTIWQFPSIYRQWHGYFAGYAHIISLADGLSAREKTMLRAVLRRRARQVYWRYSISSLFSR